MRELKVFPLAHKSQYVRSVLHFDYTHWPNVSPGYQVKGMALIDAEASLCADCQASVVLVEGVVEDCLFSTRGAEAR